MRNGMLVGILLAGLSAPAIGLAASRTVTATWTDASDNEQGFTLSRMCDAETTWAVAQTVGPNVVTVQDTVVQNPAATSRTCKYKVQAYNASGSSGDSNIATISVPTTVPAAPSGVTATVGP